MYPVGEEVCVQVWYAFRCYLGLLANSREGLLATKNAVLGFLAAFLQWRFSERAGFV